MKKDTVGLAAAGRADPAGCNSENARDVDAFFQAVRGKWKIPILGSLARGTQRFGALQRQLAPITQKVLTAQLRQLEQEGLVLRTVFAEVPPRVEYALTADGAGLLPVILATSEWGRKHRSRRASSPSKQAAS